MCNLHWCYTFCTGVTLEPALLSANQNQVIFSCVLLITVMLFICSKNNGGGLEELGDFLRAGDDKLDFFVSCKRRERRFKQLPKDILRTSRR